MNKAALLQRDYYWCEQSRYEMVLPNVHMNAGFEMDLMGVRRGKRHYIEEIEVKISKADFKADFKKKVNVKRLPEEMQGHQPAYSQRMIYMEKHEALQKGRLLPNYFSFLIPESLQPKVEDLIPEYAGLYVWYDTRTHTHHAKSWGGRIKCVKRPKILHKDTPSTELLYKKARGITFRYWEMILKR